MTVYLTHAEADQAIADELAAALGPVGFVKSETGGSGFLPLQPSDVVVAFWSQNTQFSVHRLQIEKRILEAWSEERLILVKLDHHFLPVGLRDLEAIDASFEAARSTKAWLDVKSAVQELSHQHRRGLSVPEAEFSFEGSTGIDSLMDEEEEVTVPAPAPKPAPNRQQSLLFVSYSHSDTEVVTKLVEIVKENGRTVWIDKAGITPGENWAGEIVRGIKSSDGIMVMCSSRAFESDHIKREIYLADRYRKPMLPVFIENADPPDDFEYFFAGVQHLHLFNWEETEYAAVIAQALESI